MFMKATVQVEGGETFDHEFEGEPQVGLTFTRGDHEQQVYRVLSREHEVADDTTSPMRVAAEHA